jgi:hypothetical protein
MKVVAAVAPGGAAIGFPPHIEQARTAAPDSDSDEKPGIAFAAILWASLELTSLTT